MSKKILVIYYSQTGQLGEILARLSEPLQQEGHQVETVIVKPEKDYPFPWSGKSFFAAMPDCVLGATLPLQAFQLKEPAYDLIVFGYQPWFLSPSVPANSILHDPEFKKVLKNTPVITVTGARNMWISALEKIKVNLHESGARLVGNIALVDHTQNHVSVVTISYWMFSGKKDRFLSIFPKPGVSETEIQRCGDFGQTIAKHLKKSEWDDLQNELFAQKAVVVNYNLMFTELKGAKLFKIWAGFISKQKNKTAWLVVFKYYLIIALFIAAPIILTVNNLLFRPFFRKRIQKQLAYYSGVNN